MKDVRGIAIIGLGPKGLHSLERLLAGFAAQRPRDAVTIHVVNRDAAFGCSPVYAAGQPDYIVTNNSVADIDVWGEDDPPPVGGRGPHFMAWHARHVGGARLTGREYLPRALVGRYLHDCYRHLARHVPPGVALREHVGEAVDIARADDGYVVTVATAAGARGRVAAGKILLATGHAPVAPGDAERACGDFAATSPRAHYVASVFPLPETLRGIAPGATVAMKGLGLTFIDAVLALTEGRGGRFECGADGEFAYVAGGAEPRVILPFSRSGLPAIPKAADLPATLRPLTFASAAAVAALRRRAGGRQLDFARELQPLVGHEMARAYYHAAMGPGPWRDRLEAGGDSAEALHATIGEFLRAHPAAAPFDPAAVLDPLAQLQPATTADLHGAITAYVARELARARVGHAGSPLKAAIDIWYEVRYALQPALEFGGLTPESHRTAAGGLAAQFKRVVFGPPVQNAGKILALARAGLVDFGFARAPELCAGAPHGRFELRSALPDRAVAAVDVLVDARCLPNDVARDATLLGRALLARGMIRLFANGAYRPGAIDMAPGTHAVIGADGHANPDLAVIGIPTEGNLVGNLNIVRSPFSAAWARRIVAEFAAAA